MALRNGCDFVILRVDNLRFQSSNASYAPTILNIHSDYFDCRESGTVIHPAKLSNGTIPKGIAQDKDLEDLKKLSKDLKDQKDALEKQQSCLDEPNLLVSQFL